MTTDPRATVTLPSDREILITREFDAPKHLVYKAWTTAELIKRWWSGNRGETTLVEIDLRVGGAWRYVMVARGGFEVAFHGEFRDIVPNELIVCTEVFEAMPDGEALSTATFSEADGRTTLALLMELASTQERDAVISSGMERGVQEQMVHLEQIAIALIAEHG